jgi:hypothetical protein
MLHRRGFLYGSVAATLVASPAEAPPELSVKQVEMLREAVTGLSRIAIFSTRNPNQPTLFRETEAAAASLGIQIVSVVVPNANALSGAFQEVMSRTEGSSASPASGFAGHDSTSADRRTCSQVPPRDNLGRNGIRSSGRAPTLRAEHSGCLATVHDLRGHL